jgi:prevent-host-death family protein
MEQVGIRQLRQHASAWLRRVAEGESFAVTDRGRPVALLIPFRLGDELEGLTAAGRLSASNGDLLDLDEPLLPRPNAPLPSILLEQAREEER